MYWFSSYWFAKCACVSIFNYYLFLWILFIYFWLCGVSLPARASLRLRWAGPALRLRSADFSLPRLSLVWGAGALGCRRFGSCSFRALEHRLSSCGALGLVALPRVASSQIRDGTCVSWILYHWATRKAPNYYFLMLNRPLDFCC